MLTMTMNKDELSKQIADDFSQVKKYVDSRQSIIIDNIFRKGERHMLGTLTTNNGNEWTWMIDLDEKSRSALTFFTTINTKLGRFVFKPQVTSHGFLIIAYMPHFFKRYRERMKFGTKLTTMQLIRKFFRRNGNATEEYRGNGKIELATADGVGLGNLINLRIRLQRTFITREMAYGAQEKRFAENEQYRLDHINERPIYSDEVRNELREFGMSEKDLMEKWKEYFNEKE